MKNDVVCSYESYCCSSLKSSLSLPNSLYNNPWLLYILVIPIAIGVSDFPPIKARLILEIKTYTLYICYRCTVSAVAEIASSVLPREKTKTQAIRLRSASTRNMPHHIDAVFRTKFLLKCVVWKPSSYEYTPASNLLFNPAKYNTSAMLSNFCEKNKQTCSAGNMGYGVYMWNHKAVSLYTDLSGREFLKLVKTPHHWRHVATNIQHHACLQKTARMLLIMKQNWIAGLCEKRRDNDWASQ